MKATVIDAKDNVGVVLGGVKTGDVITFKQNGIPCEITAVTDIPIYHKVCIHSIEKGESVIKYGEHIGIAGEDILAGSHVHTHNVLNHREAL